jgi:DNA-binding CsgD family transcriptional regulator
MSGGRLSGEELALDLIGAVCDAALDTQLWPDVLNRIGDAVGGPLVVFGIYDPANGLVNMHAPRTDPDMMRSLVGWAPANPSLPCIATYPPGEVFNGADVIPPDEFSGTAFYQGWWRPAGFSTEPLVTNLFADGAASGHFASHGMLNRSPFDSRQKRLFAVLAQHLVRTVALQRRLHHLTIANESTLTDLDGLEQGFLLVDSQARLLFVNRAARELLDARDGLRLEASALSTFNTDDGRTLRGLIASCAALASAEIGSGGHIMLRRGAGRLPLDVLVTPIQRETAMATVPWTFPQRAVAIVLVSDPESQMQARVESLRDRFGFTRAEATFALEIIKGDGRQATADRLGISLATARSHLSSIFDKTGSRRQAELVRLLLPK